MLKIYPFYNSLNVIYFLAANNIITHYIWLGNLYLTN